MPCDIKAKFTVRMPVIVKMHRQVKRCKSVEYGVQQRVKSRFSVDPRSQKLLRAVVVNI